MKASMKSLAAMALALSAIAAHAVPNLVANGSFEADAQAAGTWNIYSSLTSWTGINNIELRNNVAGTAQNGVNFVELDTTSNNAMKQTIAAGAGDYDLSFWYSARPGVAAGSNGLSYSFGSLSGNVLTATAGAAANVWQHYVGRVHLNGATDLTFAAIERSDSLGGSLDNVSVTAVPEPETYALMLAGLGLIGAVIRRRKANSV
jgi:hypothetical protein